MTWQNERVEVLRRMWMSGWTTDTIAKALGVTRGRVSQLAKDHGLPARKAGRKRGSKGTPGSGRRAPERGGPLTRLKGTKPGGRSMRLAKNHPAAVEGRTLFPKSVVSVDQSPRLFISGVNQRKIGKAVVKGRWKGMPIYCLTLEERATCPRSCDVWHDCYGNNMHWARRHAHGPALEHRIIDELLELNRVHPNGFVIRLHILGDFYSVGYVELWHELMKLLPGLHVFGFTAHDPESEIGAAIIRWMQWSNEQTDARAWIRFSGIDAYSLGALVIDRESDSRHVVCPAQTGETYCCGTCGLCWTMDKTIEFVRH
jgi:hypothetical protein